jgi:hypothetical protein
MKMYPVPEECLIGTLNNSGIMSTINGSLYRVAFGDNAPKFAFHEES